MLQARGLLKKGGQEVPVELLNNIGVLHFERGEFEVCACPWRFNEQLQLVLLKNLLIVLFKTVSSLLFGLRLFLLYPCKVNVLVQSANDFDVFLFASLLNKLSRRL
jgi:hypothetical protein